MKEEKRKNFKEKIDEARNERIYVATENMIYKRKTYKENYRVEPRFIKIPIWLDDDLRNLDEELFRNSMPTSEKRWFGLIVCPTESITSIEEIEVF